MYIEKENSNNNLTNVAIKTRALLISQFNSSNMKLDVLIFFCKFEINQCFFRMYITRRKNSS